MPRLADMDDDQLLTRSAFGSIIGLNTKTIANRESAGRPIVRPVYVGGVPRYRAGDVRRFVRGETPDAGLRAGDDLPPPAAA